MPVIIAKTYLGSIVGQLGSFLRSDYGYQTCSRNLSRVRSKNSIHLLPNLKLIRIQASRQQCRTKIRVSSPDR